MLIAPSLAWAQGGSCPMPVEAQLKSRRAFALIHKFVVNEPRCVNCHGAVNPHVDKPGPDPDGPNEVPSTVMHGPGAIDRFVKPDKDGVRREMEVSCIGCHDGMAPKRDGSKSRWFTAPGFLTFLNKDATQLCEQFKRATKSAEDFIGHLVDDNGGNAFTKTAFLGNRGVDGLAPIPPSISQGRLISMGREWIDAMGGQFKGDASCGCDLPKIKGKFTSIDSSPMDTIRITGDLEWKLEEPPGGGPPPPGAPLVYKPKAGQVSVEISFTSPGIASVCKGLGRRTFPVASLSPNALRFMKLEIREDGHYEVTLVIPDNPDPFPKWSFDSECVFPNVTDKRSVDVKMLSVILGRQSGTIDSERGIAGELKNPIRRGLRTITGNWSFTSDDQ